MKTLKKDDRFTANCQAPVHIGNNDGFLVSIQLEIEVVEIEEELVEEETISLIQADAIQVATSRLETGGMNSLWLTSHRNCINGISFVATVAGGDYKRTDVSKLKNKSLE